MTLPVLALEPQITAALAAGNRLVLTAPTGSGKTTQVPQILLRSGLVRGQILVLQPRRLAARWMARRVAAELGVPLGGLVGYQTRHESRIGPDTRIRFLTEGLLLRLLRDPRAVAAIGAVLLDEFHERSLAADASLALLRRLQETARPDLRLIVMSATLETARLAEYLELRGPVLSADSRLHPIEVRYLPHAPGITPVWELAAQALERLLRSRAEGDVLVFMPGAYEIRKTLEACRAAAARAGASVAMLPLHGEMSPEEQDEALRPRPERRVIVATNVAQTSITIEGVRHVIDSGIARIHRFDPLRGVNVLRVEPVSRAAAQQRAGRAGRTAPGTCERLWTQRQHDVRSEHDDPEIRRLDLAEVRLLLLDLGIEDPDSFAWPEPPEPARMALARDLLARLGATDAGGRLTGLGRRMAAIPAHPRLSRLLVEAAGRGCLDRACLWAALIGERDLLDRRRALDFARGEEESASDFLGLEAALEAARSARFDGAACRAIGVLAGAARDVDGAARILRRACHHAGLEAGTEGDLDSALQCLLVAFPDHLASRRDSGERGYVLAGDRAAVLDELSAVRGAPLLLAVEIREIEGGGSRGTVLGLASRIEPAWLLDHWPERVVEEVRTEWNDEEEAVEQVELLRFDGLVIDRTSRPEPDLNRAAAEIAERILAGRLRLDRWQEEAEPWIARCRCVAGWFPDRGLPAYGEEELRRALGALCAGATRFSRVRDRSPLDAVRGILSREDHLFVEQMAPSQVALPGRRRLRIEYVPGQAPRARARIQELFGLAAGPRVAGGRVTVLLEILGPNLRPVQTTDDLAGFWERLYPQVKRELQRRYPKHEWR